jgi:TM2 domain-containing membrane protein YozV
MDPLTPEDRREQITRLRAKLLRTTDLDLRSALEMKIGALESELGPPIEQAEAIVAEEERVLPSPEEQEKLRAEIKQLQLKEDKADDEDVREAITREILRLHFILIGRPLPEEGSEPVPVASTATRAQIDKAEGLIREARVERMRSNKTRADALMKEAQETAPGSVEVLSALGDEMVERKQFTKARDLYREALLIKPKDPVLERKLGDLVLKTGPQRTIEEQLRLGNDSPFLSPEESVANARTATFLSFFCPGLGQIVLGKTVAGIVTFVIWALMIIWLLIRKDDVKDLIGFLGRSKVQHGGGVTVLIPIGVALIVHVSAIASCAARAKRSGKRSAVDHPTPPMNLPFE